MQSQSQHRTPIVLSTAEKRRLEALAPAFDIHFAKVSRAHYTLKFDAAATFAEIQLPKEQAHLRLLAEICSRVAPWLYFHFKERCDRTLLRVKDERLLRFAELRAHAKRERQEISR